MKSKNLDKVLKMFGLMWVLTGIGFYIGQFVPLTLTVVLGLVTILLIVAMVFLRHNKVAGYILGYLSALFLGITLYPTISLYVGALGLKVTVIIMITCVIVFAAVGLFGYKLSKNLSSMGSILCFILVALVAFSFISLFVDFNNLIMLILAAVAILVFIGYTIYDFNQLAHMGDIEDEEVPLLAINLYLDLLNLIIQALKLVYNTVQFFEED